MNWPKYPVIYEINTQVWVHELSRNHGRPVSLANIPSAEWDLLGEMGIDAVWLMGVWERSPLGQAIALENPSLQDEFRRILPDLRLEDITGSPYSVRRYTVDPAFGGADGLAAARKNLAAKNIKLILDFVPNHLAPDHPWVSRHPEYFLQGDAGDLRRDPGAFLQLGGNIFACGRDPYFPPWPDVLQVNAFNDGLRKAAIETVADIARQCDGVRCDMAMLLLNDIVARTWGKRAGQQPLTEYWETLIPAVKKHRPQFKFMAEAYWGLECRLQQQGFDFCYDKRLYDRLVHDNAESVRSHLQADSSYQDRLVRFIENHDEPRAAAVFPPAKERAVATIMMTLPGAKLLHEGQLEGRKTRLPVFLLRRPDEPRDEVLRQFYLKLLTIVNQDVFRNGRWSLCECSGWPDNPSFQNLVAWCWTGGTDRYVIVTNLSGSSSQGMVGIPWTDIRASRLTDRLSGEIFERDGNQMRAQGLFVDLKPWAAHCFEVQAAI